MRCTSGVRYDEGEEPMSSVKPLVSELPVFDRKFWDGTFRCTQIGSGAIGGKAGGLV